MLETVTSFLIKSVSTVRCGTDFDKFQVSAALLHCFQGYLLSALFRSSRTHQVFTDITYFKLTVSIHFELCHYSGHFLHFC